MLTAACLPAAPLLAADIFGPDTISAIGDVRLSGVDQERSYLNGGFGKARYGSASGDFRVAPQLTEGLVVWQPKFGWALSGTVVAGAQNGQDHAVDLIESYVSLKPLTDSAVRISGRAGLMWAPISLEHAGADWHVAETITPSAINSWVGEEVKVVGTELTVTADLGDNRLSATGGLFELDDTAGTLLAFRGWSMSDYKGTAFGHIKLPPLNAFMKNAQSPQSRQLIELDDRVGWYAKIEWHPPAPVVINAFYYDNRGDPQAVRHLQWGWDTRFWNVGAVWKVDAATTLTAQGMTGNTKMGYPLAGTIWVDTDFRSAYLLATRKVGSGAISARVDLFGTRNHGSVLTTQDDEDGWTLTAAWRRPINRQMTLKLEAMRIDSTRDDRVREGLQPHQRQNVLQAAMRVTL